MTGTKRVEKNGTEKEGDYYVVPDDSTRYTRAEIMAMTMKCKEGSTKRFAPAPESRDFFDLKTGRNVYVRNDTPPPKPGKPKWAVRTQHPDFAAVIQR